MKIIFLILLGSISLSALQLDNNRTNYYLNIRGLTVNNLQDNSYNKLVTRFGIRHKQKLLQNLSLDADLRLVAENQKDNNNYYFELKRLSLEFPLLQKDQIYTKIGRMSFRDGRTWWYDNELDGVRFYHKESILSWDFSAGGRLEDSRKDDSDQRVGLEDFVYFISHLDYQYYYKKHLEFFALFEDNTKYNQKTSWLGVRSFGDYQNGVEYWIDGGTVFGDGVDNGYAIDTGAVFRGDEVSFAIDFAYGSQDYKQPHISNNKTSILGNTRYRYYGEVVDPQLSNLQILSLFAGKEVFEDNWVETAYHYYRQNSVNTQINSSFLSSLNGNSGDIGHGVDIVFGGRYSNNSKLQFVVGGFWGGDAFDETAKEKDGYRAHIDYKIKW